MDLARPQLVPVLLGALALAMAGWHLGCRRRARGWAALGRAGAPPADGSLRWLVAIAAAAFALAGPRWGRTPGPPLPPGHDVVLLVDVSRSMAAEDAVPDRLGAAVAGAQALVAAMGTAPGERAAVVAFAGRGVLRCPLTANLGAVRDVLSRLRPGDVRPGGTDLAAALAAARDAFPDTPEGEAPSGRAIVVFSDGEDLEGRGTTAIAGLRAAGIAVHAVVIGDDARPGATIPDHDRSTGVPQPLAHAGQTVHTRRVDDTLKAIATATGGAFVTLGLAQPEAVAALYDRAIAPAVVARRAVAARASRPERPGPFVLAALVAGLASVAPAWRRRPSVGLAALALLAIGADRPPEAARDATDRGRAAFRAGRYDEALAAFEATIAAAPAAPTPRYNAAVALDRLGRLDEADARYAEALARAGDEPALRASILYGRGNTAYRRGDPDAAIAHFDACLALPAGDPEVDRVRREAAVNRAFVARQAAAGPEPPDAPPRGEAPSESTDHPGDEPTAERPSAGSTTPTPAGTPAGERPEDADEPATPEARLDRAIERIRRVRSRPEADTPPPPPDPSRRDW